MIKYIALLLIGLSIMTNAKEYPKSDHFDGTRFYNLYLSKEQENGFWDYWRWRLFDRPNQDLWPESVKNTDIPHLPDQVGHNEVYITFINHATELIQLKDLTILTDPIFSERASPLSWYGPKRIRPPALKIVDLPKIDIVLISHNHYDHLDLASIREIDERYHPLFIIPLKNFHILEDAGVERMIELDWWQNYKINATQTITMVPAKHWSKRTLFDRNKSLWGSYLIHSDDLKILFIGDTGYSPHIKDIHKYAGAMDVAFIPIGAYEPRWFMKPNHINPDEAVIIHQELESKLSIATQFDTFQLANESYEAPVLDLNKALLKYHIPSNQFLAPGVGRTIHYQK